MYRVVLAGQEHWFATPAEVDEFRQDEQSKRGHELMVADEFRPAMATTTANGNGHGGETFFVQELHEVRAINRGLEQAAGVRP